MSADAPADGSLDGIRATETNAIAGMFRTYGRDNLLLFGVGGVASVLSRAMELVPAYVLAVAIDSLFFDERAFSLWGIPDGLVPADPGEQLLLVLSLLAASYVLEAGLGWVNDWCWNAFAQRFQHEVRVDTYDAMQRRGMGFFDDKQTGEVMSVLNNDVNQLEGFLTDSFNQGIRIVVRVGGMGAVMLAINWRLGIIPTLVIPVLAYVSYRFVALIHPKYQDVRSAVGRLNSRLENNVGGLTVVKAYNREEFETDRVADASREYLDSNWDAITTRIKFFPTIRLITAAGYVATFLVGGWWVMFGSPHPFFAGSLTAGTLVMFLSYTRRFIYPMRNFGQILNDYQYAEAAGERIVGLLDSEPAIRADEGSTVLEPVEGDVEYRNVSFAYEADRAGDDDGPVVRDVSFEVGAGDYVGLVGPTGAGKSTLMKLLMRLYDVDGGSVRIDGHDVREIDPRSLRRSIGYVSQDPYLFYGTVRENIAYGLENVDDREVREAARVAGAHEFVRRLPEGYETMVGERGVKLSGGQRQRISIARAILEDPEILILDEATSHVDNETEAVIQNSLEELIAERTTFAIAHRLSTVRDADRILVLDDGELVESGTHEDLLERDGLYATLWSVQVGDVDDLPREFLERSGALPEEGR
ncbi:ABC transporter ATP-binding protein [Saliphagus sp. LR7]|uniref:ABC transporter ATP-binding protein n=1 Tax=Saliphagus sp. LR7 TaxID=2282654 RepID=UPI000DF72DCB|nr:ABC transporter ATP-binding protein [Saliphagus sp. LR7]